MEFMDIVEERAFKYKTPEQVIQNAMNAFYDADKLLSAILNGKYSNGCTLEEAILFFKAEYDASHRVFDVPKYVVKGLVSAFRNTSTLDGWFPVHSEQINQVLAKKLPLTYGFEREEFSLSCGLTVFYDSGINRFYVSAKQEAV